MRPPSMRTTGLAPPDAGDATAPPALAARTAAATLTAETANNAARRTRRARVVFMLSPLLGPVVGTVFGLALRVAIHRTCRASADTGPGTGPRRTSAVGSPSCNETSAPPVPAITLAIRSGTGCHDTGNCLPPARGSANVGSTPTASSPRRRAHRPAGPGRTHQPRDCRGTLHQHPHRRMAPAQGVQQAWHQLAPGAAPGPGRPYAVGRSEPVTDGWSARASGDHQ